MSAEEIARHAGQLTGDRPSVLTADGVRVDPPQAVVRPLYPRLHVLPPLPAGAVADELVPLLSGPELWTLRLLARVGPKRPFDLDADPRDRLLELGLAVVDRQMDVVGVTSAGVRWLYPAAKGRG